MYIYICDQIMQRCLIFACFTQPGATRGERIVSWPSGRTRDHAGSTGGSPRRGCHHRHCAGPAGGGDAGRPGRRAERGCRGLRWHAQRGRARRRSAVEKRRRPTTTNFRADSGFNYQWSPRRVDLTADLFQVLKCTTITLDFLC